jgi:MFS family permease
VTRAGVLGVVHRGRSSSTVGYVVLLALSAVDAAGYSVIAPVLPAVSEATGTGPVVAGALAASFPAGMLIGFAVAGRGVRRGRTSQVLAVGLVLAAIGAAGFVAGSGLGAYFPARFLMGVGSGGLWIGITFATLERWPGQEYLCMSRIFAAYSVGGLAGPALGALGGVRGPFLAYLLLVCVTAPLVLLLGPPAARRSFGSGRADLRVPGFWLAAAGILFAILALGTLEGALPLHFATRLSQFEIGVLYVGTSLVLALAAAAAGSLRPRPLLVAAAFLIVCGVSLAGAAGTVPLWLLALLLAGAGIGLGETAALGILLEHVELDRIVLPIVVWSQLGIVGYLLGPLAGGGIAATLGFGAVGLAPLAAAVGLAVAFLWTKRAG